MAVATTNSEAKGKSGSAPPTESFFRYFQREITELQEQMDRLGKISVVGGERTDAIQHLVAAIAKLASEVNDASSYLPAYDQKSYGQVVRGLREKLDETRDRLGTRPRFTFSALHRTEPSTVLVNAIEKGAGESDNSIGAQDTPPGSSAAPTTGIDEQSIDAGHSVRDEERTREGLHVEQKSRSHITLAPSTPRESRFCSLTSLESCFVNTSYVQSRGRSLLASLTIKDVTGSLLTCNSIKGPAHVTAVNDSVIVLTCQQFRMHGCKNVDVYLSCPTRPVLEDCKRIRFAEAPLPYAPEFIEVEAGETENLWSQPLDFNNPTAPTSSSSTPQHQDRNPTWSLLPPEDQIPGDTLSDIVLNSRDRSLDDILSAAGLPPPTK